RCARGEGARQLFAVEVAADEDETRDARLALTPFTLGIALHDHVHALHDKALLLVRKREDALETQDVRSALLRQLVEPGQQLVRVEQLVAGQGDAGDAGGADMIMIMIVIVVMVVMVVIVLAMMRAGFVALVIGQEVRIDLSHAVEIEGAEIEDLVELDVAPRHLVDAGRWTERADAALNSRDIIFAD